MVWKRNHGLPPIRLSADTPRVSPAFARPVPRHGSIASGPPIEVMCGWSMSLTRFGVAKLRAAVRAMPKQYDGAGIQMATQFAHYKPHQTQPETNCDSARYSPDSHYVQHITAHPGLLSVTESVALPPQPKGRTHVKTPRIQSS